MSGRLIFFFIKIPGLCPRNRIQRKTGAFRQFLFRDLHRIDPESVLSGVIIAFDIRFVFIPQHLLHSLFKAFRQFHSHHTPVSSFSFSSAHSPTDIFLRSTIARLWHFVKKKRWPPSHRFYLVFASPHIYDNPVTHYLQRHLLPLLPRISPKSDFGSFLLCWN